MSNIKFQSIPTYLETPATISVKPPVHTRPQVLPFEQLDWKDFERLCLRLARLEANIEHCQLYGVQGDDQEGIDLFGRKRLAQKYTVYQCKNEKNFGPAKIKGAIDRFLAGGWVNKTDTLVLCTRESLEKKQRSNAIEKHRERLNGIELISWDGNRLSEMLKDKPKLVDDFFGREWVKQFCGEDAIRELGNRLDANQVIEFRNKLSRFYGLIFNQYDPGLPGLPSYSEIQNQPLKLEQRFIVPDVYDKREISFYEKSQRESPNQTRLSSSPEESNLSGQNLILTQGAEQSSNFFNAPISVRRRHNLDNWLANTTSGRSVVLGDLGRGKSTLLRFIAIDLLSESPELSALASKWGTYLPVWLPFASWTKALADDDSISLSQMLKRWLTSQNEERLCSLLDQALEDERLLLLVDGLDEWVNEDTARLAVQRLQLFVTTRNVPAIVTSRPLGFEKLSMSGAEWQIGELGEFSGEQQKAFVTIWFHHHLRDIKPDETVEQRIEKEAQQFIDEIELLVELRELAKTPLLLGLLTALKLRSSKQIPRNRFEAYEALVQLLISDHPRQRRTASGVIALPSQGIDEQDLRQILSFIAFIIQREGQHSAVHKDLIRKFLEKYLVDETTGMGLTKVQAREITRQVLNIKHDGVSILIKKSEDELGFFHRALQEYLAAYHLQTLSLQEQFDIVEQECNNTQWHEVILALFYLTKRREDIVQFIQKLRGRMEQVGYVGRCSVELLLAEIIFGNFNCPPGLANQLAQDVFNSIEFGQWMPHRQRLLLRVLDGLNSPSLGEHVQNKLEQWTICREVWRESIFQSMSQWTTNDGTVSVLLHNLYDEQMNNKKSAMHALVHLFKGDAVLGDKLRNIAYYEVDPETRSVALNALLQGWLQLSDLEIIVESARQSLYPSLCLIGILGRIQFQKQTDVDRDELIKLATWESGAGYYWRDEVATAMMTGWPGSPEIKKACIETFQNRGTHQRTLIDANIAFQVLLNGYTGDKDVIRFCVAELQENHPFLRVHVRSDVLKLLEKNFRDTPEIVSAIDQWLQKSQYDEAEISLAVGIGRTPLGKSILLSRLPGHMNQWMVHALLDYWTMDDKEVANKLIEVAWGNNLHAGQIAFYLPRIILDKSICRQRLLELLSDPQCPFSHFALQVLANLDENKSDQEVIATALKRISISDAKNNDEVLGSLIAEYFENSGIKELAQKEFSRASGYLSAIAWGCKTDHFIQDAIVKLVSPLSISLCLSIVEQLRRIGMSNEYAHKLLSKFDYEKRENVSVQLAVGYSVLHKTSTLDLNQTLNSLRRSLETDGPFSHNSMIAGFCGLITIGKSEIIAQSNMRLKIQQYLARVSSYELGQNLPLVRCLIVNWKLVKDALGDNFWKLDDTLFTALHFWDSVCPYIEQEDQLICDDLLHFLETNNLSNSIYPNLLDFIGRIKPKSDLLLRYCLAHLGTHRNMWEPPLLAGQLLGIHFLEDETVLRQITPAKINYNSISDCLIIALCEGWPKSEVFDQVISLIRQDGREEIYLSYAAHFQIMSRIAKSNKLFSEILDQLSQFDNYRQGWKYIERPIVRRLEEDDELFDLFTKQIVNFPNPSEKASLVRLINRARPLTPEMRQWCLEEINQQLGRKMSPEIGFDIVSGQLRPVAHSLLDVVGQF